MRVVKEYYKCDICGKEFLNDRSLIKREMPSRRYDCEGKSWRKGFSEVDMCEDCLDRYWNIVDAKFARIDDCYGIEVTLQDEKGR